MNKEQIAWGRLMEPPPRGIYIHPLSPRGRRETKKAKFRSNLVLSSEGCWLWGGGFAKGPNGRRYPIFNHYRKSTPDNPTRAAFNWMMREWFPKVAVRSYGQTENRCGNDLCINPYHRQVSIPNGGKGQNRMDHDLVRDIYAIKGTMTQVEAAEKFNVHTCTVGRIWSGERWSSITGQRVSKEKVMTADKARAVFADRVNGESMQVVADRYGIGRNTVRSVWYGETWASATGAVRIKPEPNRLSSATRRAILDAQGTRSAYGLAKELGVASSTVLRLWDKASLSQKQDA